MFSYVFKWFKQVILLVNVDRQFRVLLAKYIFSNLSKLHPKISQLGNERKNKKHENSRAQKVILPHTVLKVQVTKGTWGKWVHKAWGHIRQGARETRATCCERTHRSWGTWGTRAHVRNEGTRARKIWGRQGTTARETRGTLDTTARRAQGTWGTRARGTTARTVSDT